MFCEKATSHTCYSGDCGLCHGCCYGFKDITQGYKFPIYTVDSEKQYSEQEKKRLKIKKQFRELKSTFYIVPKKAEKEILRESISEIKESYDDQESYHKRLVEVTEEVLGDYEEGDELPIKYLHMASRVNPTIGGNYVCEESDGYLFCMDHFKRMYELKTEEFDGYVRQFPVFKEKIEKLMNDHKWLSRENPGTLPTEAMYNGKKYTLIQDDNHGILCDEKDCSMISHCTIVMDPSGAISNYYSTLPYYTHNKQHELCALCLLK